jgi:arginine decarboxylase-like protein
MSSIINVSIDLTKIDKSKIVEKNGKKYLSLNISVNNDVDNYGNNVACSINQSKDERDAKAPKTYLGNGRVIWTDGSINVAPQPNQGQPAQQNDDLGF